MKSPFLTNPFFMLSFNRDGVRGHDLATNEKYKTVAKAAIEILHHSLTEQAANDSASEIAREAGLTVFADDSKDAQLWEDRKWSRAAYLTYSQMNLTYTEADQGENLELRELNDVRREIINSYTAEASYPLAQLVPSEKTIRLEIPPDTSPNLDALMKRRSQRQFSDADISFKDFSFTLYEATTNIRTGEESRLLGDSLFIFNSFYSWVKLYIAVQGVVDIPRGLYQYDPTQHQLRLIQEGVENHDIYSCIQYQSWIQGGGFCVFISAHWERYMWIYRHSRAYINLLIQAGELGQEIFMAANKYGLGGWGTPAVDEDMAASFLSYDSQQEDALYFLKIGQKP